MKQFLFIIIFVLCVIGNVFALTGLELAQQVYDRDDGDDAQFQTKMVLIDKSGNRRERLLDNLVKDYEGRLKSYVEFLEPTDIKGTKFLSWENQDGDDTQYLYLPELGRSRRIVSSQKKLRFVNTDFTYEDMQRRHPQEDEHKILNEDVYFGQSVYVLESIPKDGESQYGRLVSLIEKESLIPVSIDYYDKKDRRIKELRVFELQQIEGIWTIMKVEMYDLKAEHRTRMSIKSVLYNQGLDDKFFELRNLEK